MDIRLLILLSFLLACTKTEESKRGEAAGGNNIKAAVPTSLDSRFGFGLGGLGGLGGLINNLIPEFNLGNQGGFGGYPFGTNFPTNSQFYPNSPPAIQGITPNIPVSSGQGSTWPVIDDASQFNNQGNNGGAQQTQYPQQYPTQGNQWGYPQYNFGGSQYPSQGNFGGNSQFPNQGNYPSQMTQYPNQGNFVNPQNPNQGNFGGTQLQNPSFPANNGVNTMPIQFPNQGGSWNQYPNYNQPETTPEGGTLDSIVPPVNTDAPDVIPPVSEPPFKNPTNGNAILGNPVVVPPSGATNDGKIIYPSSKQSPSKKQCVQDCQTTTEYNPVCGSDNVTYINPGKFVCARNCGMNVFVVRNGRCQTRPKS